MRRQDGGAAAAGGSGAPWWLWRGALHGRGRITELLNAADPEVMGCSDLSCAWVRSCGSSGFPEGPYRDHEIGP